MPHPSPRRLLFREGCGARDLSMPPKSVQSWRSKRIFQEGKAKKRFIQNIWGSRMEFFVCKQVSYFSHFRLAGYSYLTVTFTKLLQDTFLVNHKENCIWLPHWGSLPKHSGKGCSQVASMQLITDMFNYWLPTPIILLLCTQQSANLINILNQTSLAYIYLWNLIQTC